MALARPRLLLVAGVIVAVLLAYALIAGAPTNMRLPLYAILFDN